MLSDASPGLSWLYGFADQERGVGWNPRASPAEQWKLGRTRALLDLAGAPDHRLRLVLVAGTKGKGSTSAMLASILAADGCRAGLYTQPHLQSYRERIRVDGQSIAPDAFELAVDRWRGYVDALHHRYPSAGEPTTFEITTALAIDHFVEQGCEIGVLEVGLGGRLDATNAVEPTISVITPISHDHTAILGPTLGAIATEKAGILRRGRPALLASQRPAARRALARACRASGAACQEVPPTLHWPLALAGEHQRQNAALAVAAARQLLDPPDAAIRLGLARLRWPGRFEVVPGQPTIVLDGAHNDASAAALAATLCALATGEPRAIQLIVGIHQDKDARAVLRPLLPLAETVWATQAADSPRALDARRLARLCHSLGRPARPAPLAEALAGARAAAGSEGLVCVTGSLLLVGQARAQLGLPVPERLW